MVDRHGVRPDPEAVEAVLTRKAPRMHTELMIFLGFANYYREFVKDMQTRYTHAATDPQQRKEVPLRMAASKVLSDTEMKYGAPKAEMFAVVTFVEKYSA